MDLVTQLWPTLRKGSQKLPLPTPVSLTRNTLNHLAANQYMVGVKNDGVRAVALCMLDDQINYVKLINRKGKETFQRLIQGDEPFFHGTLLDIEVMPDKSWVLLDVIAMEGFSTISDSFPDRLAKVTDEHIKILRRAGIQLRKKAWYSLAEFDTCIQNLSGDCDGLIFMPLHDPIRVGRHNTMYKWKEKHTVDLVYKNGNFCCMTRSGLQPMQNVVVESSIACKENAVYECLIKKPQQLIVLFERTDKHIPNFITTVENCVQCVREGLGLEELTLLVKKITF
jgi:hypothetical protein